LLFIVRWLTGLAETSPVLSFVRAAVLGYSSHGNSVICYRAFPRCPRNPDKLVHYLNNHNGGFFQFFSRVGHGSYPPSFYALRGRECFVDSSRTTFKILYELNRFRFSTDSSKILGERKRKAPPPGIVGAETDRTGTGKLKFDIPVLSARQDYERSFFPTENTLENSGRVIFSDHEELSDRPLKNKIPKSLSDLRDFNVNTFSQNSPLVFPQVKLYLFRKSIRKINKINEKR